MDNSLRDDFKVLKEVEALVLSNIIDAEDSSLFR